jgi:hypothetical protein
MRLDDGTAITVRTQGDSPAVPGARFTAGAAAGTIHLFDGEETALARP